MGCLCTFKSASAARIGELGQEACLEPGRAFAEDFLIVSARVLCAALIASCSQVRAAKWGLLAKASTSACLLQEEEVKVKVQVSALADNSSCAGAMPLLLAHASAAHSSWEQLLSRHRAAS